MRPTLPCKACQQLNLAPEKISKTVLIRREKNLPNPLKLEIKLIFPKLDWSTLLSIFFLVSDCTHLEALLVRGPFRC